MLLEKLIKKRNEKKAADRGTGLYPEPGTFLKLKVEGVQQFTL